MASIPDNMRVSYARQTARELLSRNLEHEMGVIKSQNGGEIPPIEGYILDKCRERKKCKLAIPAGRKRSGEIPDRKFTRA